MTILLVSLFYELCAVRVVAEDAFNHPDRDYQLYLWVVLQAHWFMEESVKENFS